MHEFPVQNRCFKGIQELYRQIGHETSSESYLLTVNNYFSISFHSLGAETASVTYAKDK
jgi:hypothetical protein